jgi:hypothetical protein
LVSPIVLSTTFWAAGRVTLARDLERLRRLGEVRYEARDRALRLCDRLYERLAEAHVLPTQI